MTDKKTKTNPVPCVGVICFRGDDVLLIQRGKPPKQGEWSLPGGRIEHGETELDALHRELFEETRTKARIGQKITIIDIETEGFHYRLHDYLAHWTEGEPKAGDDAMDAKFINPDELESLTIWNKTREVIEMARRAHQASPTFPVDA